MSNHDHSVTEDLRPATHRQTPNRMKQINGFTVVEARSFHREDSTLARVVILGARANDIYADDYAYVVAELDSWEDTSWPSGQYFQTLAMALDVWRERVDYTKRNVQFPVVKRLV